MGNYTILKKIGVNFTVLASSIALAACGGGGGGYYGDNNTGGSTGNGADTDPSVKEATGVSLTLNKNELNVKGDELTITAKALDKNGGGVEGKTIVLNIADYVKNGAASDTSEKITDAEGNATFTVKLDGTNLNLTQLTFTTTIKGTTINNIRNVAVTGAGTVVQSQYELIFDSIGSLPVSGGESTVKVRAVDANGGGVPNENVTLAVKDFKINNVTIKGSSSAVTDNEGYAIYTIVLPKGKEVDRQTLITTGVSLEATLTESSGATKTQISNIAVDSVKNVASSLSVSTSNNNKVDAIDGSINVVVKVSNPEGNTVANKTVNLSLDDLAVEYGAKLVSPTAITNSNGEATFTVKTEANSANTTGQLLVTNGINVIASLSETNIATQTTKITVVSTPAEEVAYLNAVVSEQIEIKGGQTTVVISAKDKNGGALANKQIVLNIPNSQNNGLTIVNGSKVITDSNGQAAFNISYSDKDKASTTIEGLLKNGVTISAAYTTVASTVITQTTKISFYQQQTIEQSKEVQRLELTATKGVVSSNNDTVQIKVRAIEASGNFAANKAITIGLTPEATENGVKFEGAATKSTDSSGYATYTLSVNAQNKEAIESLVSSGIAIAVSSALADGTSVKQNMQVMVEAASLDTVNVSYLTISADQMININKGQATITVVAKDSNGGTLTGQNVTLNVANSAINGLTLIGGSKAITDNEGKATFVLKYDGTITDKEVLAKLKSDGVLLTATYQSVSSGNVVVQTTSIHYYEQNADINVKQLDITLAKGVVVAGSDNVEVTVEARDEKGQFVPNRKINLVLTDIAKNNGASISGPSSQTPDNGRAVFNVKLLASNSDAINALVAEGLLLTATVEQNNGSTVSQSAKVMVAASASSSIDIAYLAIENFSAINIDANAERVISVKAYNSVGVPMPNKDVALSFSKAYSGIKIKEGTKLTTNAAGEVKFTLVYDESLSITEKQQLLNDGLIVTANYGSVSQTVKTEFYQQAVNIQRMDLVVDQSALVLDTPVSNNPSAEQKATATVILKDSQGAAVSNRQVTLAIDLNSLQNGVSIDGSTGGSIVVVTDTEGRANVGLSIAPKTAEAVKSLVASGIGIGASAIQGDGVTSLVQNTKINVTSSVSLAEVSYLTTLVSDTIKTTGGSSTITVKAFNSNGTPITNKQIKLNLGSIPLGLNIKLASNSALTNANGEAEFKVTYIAPATLIETQVKELLAGIQSTAIYTSTAGLSITQTTIVQFNIDESDVAKDASRIELSTSKGSVVADNDTFTFTGKVFDKDGNPLKNKKVGIGLNAAALENGVQVDSNSKMTNQNGEVTFTLTVKSSDDQKIQNLISNGITVAASVNQADGTTLSQSTQVMVTSPLSKDIIALVATPQKQTLSILGDTTVIAVKAEDSEGKGLVSREVNFALSPSLSSRVKVDRLTALTDSEGLAYFTVTLAEGDIENLLLEKGITYAVTTYNNGSTKPINQIGKINVTAPVEATNLVLSKSKDTLLAFGDTAEVYTKLVDQAGNPIKGYPVALTVIDSAFNGVTIDGANNAMTDASGNAKFKINLSKITGTQYDELLQKGVTISASVTLANGVQRTKTEHFDVEEPINSSQLRIGSSRPSMNVAEDKSVITVALSDLNGISLKNNLVKLTVKQTASTTASNVGIDVGESDLDPVRPLEREATVLTDDNGNAFYTLVIPSDGHDKDALVASGIELEASYTDVSGIIKTQVYRIAVNPVVVTPTTLLSTRYSLRIASGKPTLNVRSDISDVTVTLVDENGGGAANKYVTLALDKFKLNGASIVGASGLTTDENGQATFKVKVDETSRDLSYSAADFTLENLNLTAKFNETGYVEASQISQIDVVNAIVANPVASIVIGVNPTEISSSSDGVYYTQNLSASVVDFDGKPLANQEVVMDVTPISYTKGENLWALAPVPMSDPQMKWIFSNQSYYSNNNVANGLTTNTVITCNVNPNGAPVMVGNNTIPVKVVTFTKSASSETNTVTYTTDLEGKFDFTIRYPKIYAQWLNVRIGAASTVASLPNRTSYDLGLASASTDYSSDGTYSPNKSSPYGIGPCS